MSYQTWLWETFKDSPIDHLRGFVWGVHTDKHSPVTNHFATLVDYFESKDLCVECLLWFYRTLSQFYAENYVEKQVFIRIH